MSRLQAVCVRSLALTAGVTEALDFCDEDVTVSREEAVMVETAVHAFGHSPGEKNWPVASASARRVA
jgi:hypothetical protein